MASSSNTRKQQEILARDALILLAANEMFAEQGYHSTTMQNIADKVGYSKGTIYQHYACKEDVLAKLFIQCGETLQVDMQKVIDAKLDIRPSILLITGIFLKHTKEVPGVAGNVTLVKSPAFIAKLAPQYQDEIKHSEQIMLSQIIGIFSECEYFDCDQVKSAAFGWWSMQIGVQNLMVSGWDITAMGFKTSEEHIIESLNIFIDGLGIPSAECSFNWSNVKKKMQQILEINEF